MGLMVMQMTGGVTICLNVFVTLANSKMLFLLVVVLVVLVDRKCWCKIVLLTIL